MELLGIEMPYEEFDALIVAQNNGKQLKVVNKKVVAVDPEPYVPTTEDKILELKQLLQKYKEDIEQVELFGMERADYEDKKQKCADIIIHLRELENSKK